MPSALAPFALLTLSLSQTAPTATSTEAAPLQEGLPFSDDQLDYLERMRDELREGAGEPGAAGEPGVAPPIAERMIELQAEAYMKWLFRNNTSQGCVTYGNPHPRGDNYTGDNGACPEFALTLLAHPSPRIEGGFRLQSRFGQQFADWFENGDEYHLQDASGESLGQNHSAPIQLRGIYVRVAEPLPLINWFLAGSSDLSYFDAWTVGKVRFIDRFNAKGLFVSVSAGEYLDLIVARIALSKLFGTANYNALEEPLITNPFWARDAIYAVSLSTPKRLIDGVSLVVNGGLSIDEEADVRDPDAPGSTNTADPKDDVAAVDARFVGLNASLAIDVTRFEDIRVRALLAASKNDVNPRYVSNLSRLGYSNVVYADVFDLALTLRIELPEILGDGRRLEAEYFNIGSNFNAVAGARREDDVLLTDGFLDGGQLPTLNVANELIDFTDLFYESIVGWHGGTLLFSEEGDLIDLGVEGTLIEYNTDLQGRDRDVYPDFGGFTGFTDTDLYSYANTNNRGRDPRSVYARDQGRRTLIFMGRLALKPNWWAGARIEAKSKIILDKDIRSDETREDDYAGTISVSRLSIAAQPLDELSISIGTKLDRWIENGRSGTYSGEQPRFFDYKTTKVRPFIDVRYSIGALSASYHIELVAKRITTDDAAQNEDKGPIWRSIGTLSAQF